LPLAPFTFLEMKRNNAIIRSEYSQIYNKAWLMESIFSGNSFIKSFLTSILIFLAINTCSFSQSRESLVKAGYIEKFTHFVQWPEKTGNNDPANEFILAVIGKNTFGKDLEELFSKTKIKDNQVRIKYITKVEEIKDCMILFISGSEKNNLDKILEYTTGKSILTISDSKGFGKNGVIINMFSEGDYIKYEVNRNTLEKSGLKINSLLLNHAVIISSDN
jgi:hypothetical protein